jgi:membrane protease YdiL (CAAX protease family)
VNAVDNLEQKQGPEQAVVTPAIRGAASRVARFLLYVICMSVGWFLLALLPALIIAGLGHSYVGACWFFAAVLVAIIIQIPKFLKRAGADIESAWYLITVAMGWSLLASVPLDQYLIGAINGYRHAEHLAELSPGSREFITAIPLIDIVLILAALIRARIVGHGNVRQGLADVPLSKLPVVKSLAWQTAAYAVFLKVLLHMMIPDMLSEDWSWQNLDRLFVLILFAPIAEELFFRGWLWTGLAKRLSVYSTIGVTSAIWLALHVQQYGRATIFLVPTTLLLARARHYGESVRAPIALHITYNFITAILP